MSIWGSSSRVFGLELGFPADEVGKPVRSCGDDIGNGKTEFVLTGAAGRLTTATLSDQLTQVDLRVGKHGSTSATGPEPR